MIRSQPLSGVVLMSTPHILFEQIENAGYINGDAIDVQRIRRATLTELIELGEESALLTSPEVVPQG
jgi:hypothetical protein